MKHNKYPQDDSQKPAGAAEGSQAGGTDFAPSADEVARRAYFSFLNEGSQPGRDVQHWLASEAELIKERDLTRVHGFHNQT
jgi:hypothetical protein